MVKSPFPFQAFSFKNFKIVCLASLRLRVKQKQHSFGFPSHRESTLENHSNLTQQILQKNGILLTIRRIRDHASLCH
mgnify:CR=1 FL=1